MMVNGFAAVASHTFAKADLCMDNLGQPYGISAYKPYHSSGEGYLHAYLGMLGLPMDIVPEFPRKATLFFSPSALNSMTILLKKYMVN